MGGSCVNNEFRSPGEIGTPRLYSSLSFAQKKATLELKARREIKLLERKQFQLAAKEKLRKEKEQDIAMIEDLLLENMPLCKEATALSLELGKDFAYSLRLHIAPVEGVSGSTKQGRLLQPSLVCVARNAEGEILFEWDCETLENRVFLMRELFDHWVSNELFDIKALPLSRDPFWDPVSRTSRPRDLFPDFFIHYLRTIQEMHP